MGLPLRLCAVVAVAMCCSLALADNVSQPSDKTGSSANLGKWWVRTAQSKKAQPEQIRETEDSEPARQSQYVPQADTSSQSDSSFRDEASSYGYSFAQHQTEHFHLMYRQQAMPSPIVGKTGDLLEHAYQKFVTEFKKAGFSLAPVTDRLTWIVFSDEYQYRDYARLADNMNAPYLESYYAARSNQVVLMQLSAASRWNRDTTPRRATTGGSLSPQVAGMDEPQASSGYGGEGMLEVRRAVHEAAHQLAFNTGLQKRGVMYPLWISEGLATNFECDTAAELGVAGDNPPRKRQLMRAWSNGRLMSLNSFATMVNIRADGGYSANDLYAQAWAFFNFLFKNRKAELKAYLADLAQTEEGARDEEAMRAQFVRAFGSIDRLEREWIRHLDSMSRK